MTDFHNVLDFVYEYTSFNSDDNTRQLTALLPEPLAVFGTTGQSDCLDPLVNQCFSFCHLFFLHAITQPLYQTHCQQITKQTSAALAVTTLIYKAYHIRK